MRCETCKDSPFPGHVPRRLSAISGGYVPCPDCNGSGQQHCCDGPVPSEQDVRERADD